MPVHSGSRTRQGSRNHPGDPETAHQHVSAQGRRLVPGAMRPAPNCRQHYRDQELARLPPEPPGSPSEHGLRRKCRHVTLSGRPRHDSRISVSKINALAAPPVTAFDAAIHILAPASLPHSPTVERRGRVLWIMTALENRRRRWREGNVLAAPHRPPTLPGTIDHDSGEDAPARDIRPT